MKRFFVSFISICYMCLLSSLPALASCSETPVLTIKAEIINKLGIIDKGNGFQVNPALDIDFVRDVLSTTYYVDDTYLSILISDEDDKWGYFDKQSYFLMLPQFDCVFDDYTTDIYSPIFCEQDDHFGYVSRTDGSIVIPFIFNGYCELSEFIAGYALGCTIVTIDDETMFSYTLLRSDGTIIRFPEGIMPISHPYGSLVLLSNVPGTGNYDDTDDIDLVGIGNIDGEVLIPPTVCYDFDGIESYFYPYYDYDLDYE